MFRTYLFLLSWIRIRIDITNPDPEQKNLQKLVLFTLTLFRSINFSGMLILY